MDSGNPEPDADSTPGQRAPWFAVAALAVAAIALAVAGAIALALLRAPATRSAALAPPGSVFYASVFVEPSVGQRRALDDLGERAGLERLLPEGDLVAQLLDPYLAPLGLDHARDVDPWLGPEIGLSVMEGSDDGVHVAAFLEASDPDAAAARLSAAPIETRERSYRDVSYRRLPRRGNGAAGGWAFGILDDFVLVANAPAAFEAAVDAARGAALADEEGFDAILDPLPDDRLMAAYVGDSTVVGQLPLPPLARGIAEKLAGGEGALAVSLHAESDAIVLAGSRGEPVRLEADLLAALIRNLPIGR